MTTSRVAKRLRPYGATVFAGITKRAQEVGAINLGQGFPNFDGPDFVKEAAIERDPGRSWSIRPDQRDCTADQVDRESLRRPSGH